MSVYNLIKDGKTVNRILADEDFIEKIRHEYDSVELVQEVSTSVETIPVIPQARKLLNSVEFKLQFTQTERLAFKAARLYQGSDSAKVTQKLVLDDLFEIVDDPRLTEINLDSLQIKEVIESLVLNGLIVQERADQILAGV